MAFAASQRVIYKIGNVVNWLHRTDLSNRRIRLVDFDGQVVGRASTVVATALQGKDRVDYTPQQDMGDVVVVINADKAIMTGKKTQEKVYYRHSGKPGNLKTTTPAELRERFGGAAVVWKAVSGMLPKNRLRDKRMDRVLIYNDDRHDFDDRTLFPLPVPPRPEQASKQRWILPEGFEPMNGDAFYTLWQAADPEWRAKMEALAAKRREAVAAHPGLGDDPTGRSMQGLRVQ